MNSLCELWVYSSSGCVFLSRSSSVSCNQRSGYTGGEPLSPLEHLSRPSLSSSHVCKVRIPHSYEHQSCVATSHIPSRTNKRGDEGCCVKGGSMIKTEGSSGMMMMPFICSCRNKVGAELNRRYTIQKDNYRLRPLMSPSLAPRRRHYPPIPPFCPSTSLSPSSAGSSRRERCPRLHLRFQPG